MNTDILLKLKDIKKSFGTNTIHRGVSLELHKGESMGLLGGSGTGKSVLLRSIIGLENIDGGEIYFKDQRIDKYTEDQMLVTRKNISYSFQSGALFDSHNVFENLAFPLIQHTSLSYEEIKDKVKQMLQLIDLPGRELLMPSDLSGGMQKRVGMARSMILDPSIILYDEPTAGLDPLNTQNVVDLMKKLKSKGHASIFVTHDIPSALQLCDRIIILGQGIIIFNDTPEAFKNSDNPEVTKFKSQEDKIKGKSYGH
jgi:phospholipid/cholesterol/gamma-HCH transport system ATP-binding protein